MTKEGKYIHYCWFGKKPLPKLAKKCLASWKKYLPDYEVIRWDESNCDFDECEFVKKAYETKYYAFVADYIRTKAMRDMGGIYFDTDMEIIEDPRQLLKDCTSFLGVEDTGKVCCGVWYEKFPNSYLATELLKKYQGFRNIDFEKRNEFSIPLLITEILEPCGFDYKKRSVQVLEHNIAVFPRDYFYPYSYNRTNNIFTENTCMIHYYDASWLPAKNRIENFLVRRYGRKRALQMIKAYQKSYVIARKTARVVLFPVTLKIKIDKQKRMITPEYLDAVERTVAGVNKYKDSSYIVLHNGGWFGVTSATKELFRNNVDCRELYRKKDIEKVANAIIKSGTKQVIFSAMSIGGPRLAKMIHGLNPEIRIKVFWHGSLSQVLDKYGWNIHEQIMRLHREGVVTAFATCKKSLLNFYKKNGVNAYFITNKVDVRIRVDKHEGSNQLKVGLYAASPSNWRKNMFSQIAAVSLMRDVILDIVPLDEVAESFARSLGVRVTGESSNIARSDLIKRMAGNDVNLYVTFSECSPMLPLESLEVGVPCITGNNHHYFEDNELEKYLVVSQEDNPEAIRDKIKTCVEKRGEIMKAYVDFREKNLCLAKRDVKSFLEDGND